MDNDLFFQHLRELSLEEVMASLWLSRAPASPPIASPITRKRSCTEYVR